MDQKFAVVAKFEAARNLPRAIDEMKKHFWHHNQPLDRQFDGDPQENDADRLNN
jgi:hypothetical protein